MRNMRISIFLVGLLIPGVFPDPSELSTWAAITFVQQGGLLSYDVDVNQCDVYLPPDLPINSFGDYVNDVITFADHNDQFFSFEFSLTREINGTRYNLTDGVVRFTEVSVNALQVAVQITDVNEDAPSFLQTGPITCDLLNAKGVKLYGRSVPGEELTSYGALVGRLRMGYDVNYVLNWDMCSPNTPETKSQWSGRISGYRFSPKGDIEFTQLVNTAQKELYMVAAVSDLNTVQVKMYKRDRFQRQISDIVSRSCALGKAYRVYVAKSP